MKFATKPVQYYPLHLRHVAMHLADIQQIWKKMQRTCILSAPILSPSTFAPGSTKKCGEQPNFDTATGPAHVVQWSSHLGAMCSRA